MNNKEQNILGCIGLFLFALMIWGFYKIHVSSTNYRQLKIALIHAENNSNEAVYDYWDNRIITHTKIDKRAAIYNAYSAGPDKVFHTEDDYFLQKIDFNKSRIIGEWVGTKTKQFLKGKADGLKKESKFDKNE